MKKILWLCSWYPHPGNPYEGDFVQRHAKALLPFLPVSVLYVNQDGFCKNVGKNEIIEHYKDGVYEKLIFFKFKKTGVNIIDNVVYNIRYYRTYKKSIKNYFLAQGKPDIIHIHVPMKAGMLGRWIKKKWGIPYILSEQSSHYNGETGDDFFAKSFIHRYNVKRVFQGATAVTNVSDIVGEKLKELFALPAVRAIHNTVDTRLFYYRELKISKFRFIHVSSLMPHHKNIEGILGSLSRLARQRQDFEFVIVGPVTDGLRKKVKELGLIPIVKFTGEIAYPEVAAQMQQASAFVLFSRYENFPCVMIEALCCGLPFISSDTGGIKEAINETNGILVQSENQDQLMEAMNRMMKEYHKYDRAQIAYEASQRFSYDTIGRKFYELYNEVAESKATG